MREIWGNFFAVPDGYSKTKAADQAFEYCGMIDKYAQKHGIAIALESTANPRTVFPKRSDGLAFAKQLGLSNIRVMADLNYFVAIDEPFEDIAIDPSYCVHVHIQGDTYQPNYGNSTEKILHIFRVLKKVGYQRTVSSAHPWISTVPGPFDYRPESAKALQFLVELRDRVFAV